MAKAASILLVTKTRKAHGVHEQTTDQTRLALCTVRKVRQSEYYQAQNAGYSPEYQFNLTLAADYHGESSLIYEGREYRVVRIYETPAGGLEITAERSDRNEQDENDENGDAGDG